MKLMRKAKVILLLADIRADSDVEILNPDLHIATLSPDARLHMRIHAGRGRGYVNRTKISMKNNQLV